MPTNSDDRAATSRDTEPRQATTSHVNSDDRATTSGVSVAALSQPQPLTVEEAAQLLGVSPRTVQRRCQNGKLSAKQTQGEFGEVWEIDRQTVEKMAGKQPRQAATESGDKPRQSDDREPRQATTSGVSVAATSAAADDSSRARNADQDDAAPDFRAKYIAELEAANGFLKSQIEDANRNAAELRAALRAALKLTAGTSAPQLTTGTPEPPERGQSGAAGNVPSATLEDGQRPAKRDGAALSYGDIADELERLGVGH
jgi:excisionase family DNA binding protein